MVVFAGKDKSKNHNFSFTVNPVVPVDKQSCPEAN